MNRVKEQNGIMMPNSMFSIDIDRDERRNHLMPPKAMKHSHLHS